MTFGLVSQLSVAVAEKVADAPLDAVASFVTSAGTVSTGAVVSTATLPAAAAVMYA